MRRFGQNSKKHIFSGIDARVKILVALTAIALVLSYKGAGFPLFIAGICLLVTLKMRIPLRAFLVRFAEPAFIVFFLVIIKCLFTGHDTLYSIDLLGIPITAHRDGLIDGLLIASRIFGAVSILALLGFSTPFTEFMTALSWFRIPRGFIEILMFAYRAIFLLFDDAYVIYNAQKNRLGYVTIRRGLGSFGVLAGSLTLKAFDNSQNTATAMIQRGYDGTMPCSAHRPLRSAEVYVSILLIAIMGILWKL